MPEPFERRPGPLGWLWITLAGLFLGLLVALPSGAALEWAFREGWQAYLQALTGPLVLQGLGLSLGVAALVVPLNAALGLVLAWLLARFRFPGNTALRTLIDLPFSISPIVVGLMFVLLYGRYGLLGPWLEAWGFRVIFAWPGLVLTSAFITIPFVAKEVLPTLEAQGAEEEEAALTLGARGFTLFWRVTLPKIRWALLYGTVLSTARALGEFGAASVVSGLIRGRTSTLPLVIEILHNEYQTSAAFAAGTLFLVFAAGSLILKGVLRRRRREEEPR